MPRFLLSNIVWGASLLSPNAQARLPRVMIVDAECADEVFKRAEERHEGATIQSAESEPLGETPSMDDLNKVREATRNRIAQGVKDLMRPGYTVEGMSVIIVSPPCATLPKRVREDDRGANRFTKVPRGRHLSTLLFESDWRHLASSPIEGTPNTIGIYSKNGRIIVVEEFGPEGADGVELFYPSGMQKITDLVAEANAYAADVTISIPTNRVREETTHSYVAREDREPTRDDSIFTFQRYDTDGSMIYGDTHELWNAVEIHLPEGFFAGRTMAPHFIAIPNFVVEPVRPDRVRESAPPQYVLAKDQKPTPWVTFVPGSDRYYVEHRIYEVRGDGFGSLVHASTDKENIKEWSGILDIAHIVVSVKVREEIIAANHILPPAAKDAALYKALRLCPVCRDSACETKSRACGKEGRTDRVSEGRPVYRVPRRRLHIEDDGGLTFCGEIIQYLPEGSVTDDVMGTLAHEPKGTCGRCIHYALIEVGGNAGRTAA